MNEDTLRNKGFQQQPDGSWAKTAGTKSNPEMPPPPHEVKTEKLLQEQIANWLRQHDTWFCRSRMDRKTSNGLGTPDFLFTWPYQRGGFAPVAVECKIGNATLSEEQERVRKEMLDCGWFYFV